MTYLICKIKLKSDFFMLNLLSVSSTFMNYKILANSSINIDLTGKSFYVLSITDPKSIVFDHINIKDPKQIIPLNHIYYSFSEGRLQISNIGRQTVTIKGWHLGDNICTENSFVLNYSNNMKVSLNTKRACFFSPPDFISSTVKFVDFDTIPNYVTYLDQDIAKSSFINPSTPFVIQILSESERSAEFTLETIGLDKNINNKCGVTSYHHNSDDISYIDAGIAFNCSTFTRTPFSIILYFILYTLLIGLFIFLCQKCGNISISSYFAPNENYRPHVDQTAAEDDIMLDNVEQDVTGIDL